MLFMYFAVAAAAAGVAAYVPTPKSNGNTSENAALRPRILFKLCKPLPLAVASSSTFGAPPSANQCEL